MLKSGSMDGAPLSAEGVKKLADLESREVLLAKAAGVLKAKIGQAAFAFNALPVKAVRTIDALRESSRARRPDETGHVSRRHRLRETTQQSALVQAN